MHGYDFRTNGGNGTTVIPVADGDFLTPPMSQDYDKILVHVRFFSDANRENEVDPTGGTITVTATPDGVNYESLDSGTYEALDNRLDSRIRPNGANKPAIRAKITLTGVTGANYMTAEAFRW